MVSRRSAGPATAVDAAGCDSSSGLMKTGGAVVFEMETSEHTLPDTPAVQLSPTDSLGSSSLIRDQEHPDLRGLSEGDAGPVADGSPTLP